MILLARLFFTGKVCFRSHLDKCQGFSTLNLLHEALWKWEWNGSVGTTFQVLNLERHHMTTWCKQCLVPPGSKHVGWSFCGETLILEAVFRYIEYTGHSNMPGSAKRWNMQHYSFFLEHLCLFIYRWNTIFSIPCGYSFCSQAQYEQCIFIITINYTSIKILLKDRLLSIEIAVSVKLEWSTNAGNAPETHS